MPSSAVIRKNCLRRGSAQREVSHSSSTKTRERLRAHEDGSTKAVWGRDGRIRSTVYALRGGLELVSSDRTAPGWTEALLAIGQHLLRARCGEVVEGQPSHSEKRLEGLNVLDKDDRIPMFSVSENLEFSAGDLRLLISCPSERGSRLSVRKVETDHAEHTGARDPAAPRVEGARS